MLETIFCNIVQNCCFGRDRLTVMVMYLIMGLMRLSRLNPWYIPWTDLKHNFLILYGINSVYLKAFTTWLIRYDAALFCTMVCKLYHVNFTAISDWLLVSIQVHGLSKDQLAMRQVEVIDIASSVRDYWSYLVSSCNVNLSTFRSAKTNRGPLVEGWKVSPQFPAYLILVFSVCL